MHAKLRRAAGQFRYLVRALGIVRAAAPRWMVAWAALLLVQGVLPVAPVYLSRVLVNRLVAAKNAVSFVGRR